MEENRDYLVSSMFARVILSIFPEAVKGKHGKHMYIEGSIFVGTRLLKNSTNSDDWGGCVRSVSCTA